VQDDVLKQQPLPLLVGRDGLSGLWVTERYALILNRLPPIRRQVD
jgi:hypothetical protein